jgi:hypothetical protein
MNDLDDKPEFMTEALQRVIAKLGGEMPDPDSLEGVLLVKLKPEQPEKSMERSIRRRERRESGTAVRGSAGTSSRGDIRGWWSS